MEVLALFRPLSEQLVLACGHTDARRAEILIRKGAPLSIPATFRDPRVGHEKVLLVTPLGAACFALCAGADYTRAEECVELLFAAGGQRGIGHTTPMRNITSSTDLGTPVVTAFRRREMSS